jgi:BirA family transcriptional regulator, biotin operon repressor / biotin---[acetyl-CoA-carboxylase] ligase
MPNQSSQPHSFDLAELDAAIASTQFHGHVHHLVSTPSTNDLALEAAQKGARNGVWIADQQIAGRGRGAHTWHSTAGDGLYMTALVAPPIPMQNALALSMRVAIAVQFAIASTYGFRIREEIDIRWPNDLLLNGKKCGGILIDTASNPATPTRPATLRYAIVGIGINLNHTAFPPELEPIATSIRRESFTRSVENSTKCRREPLAAAILIALDDHIRRLTQPATDNLQPATLSTWIQGKRVRVEARDGHASYTGTTVGLNSQGFLLVAADDGQIRTVLSGGLREP